MGLNDTTLLLSPHSLTQFVNGYVLRGHQLLSEAFSTETRVVPQHEGTFAISEIFFLLTFTNPVIVGGCSNISSGQSLSPEVLPAWSWFNLAVAAASCPLSTGKDLLATRVLYYQLAPLLYEPGPRNRVPQSLEWGWSSYEFPSLLSFSLTAVLLSWTYASADRLPCNASLPQTWGSSACSSTSACHRVRLFSDHSSVSLLTSLCETHSLNILGPCSSWILVFQKHPENCLVTKMLRVYSLLTTPYRLRLCGQTDDSACLLWCSPILPFLWSDTFFSILPPFPSLTDLLGTGDFLAPPLLGGGVHIFTRAAALKLFKSSDPRYIWLYLTQLGFEQAFFRNSSLNCFFAFWKALLAKIWCCEAHKHFIGPVMSVSHLLGGNAFRSVFTLVQAAHFKRPLSLDRHTSSFTSVFLLWKTPQVSPTL